MHNKTKNRIGTQQQQQHQRDIINNMKDKIYFAVQCIKAFTIHKHIPIME